MSLKKNGTLTATKTILLLVALFTVITASAEELNFYAKTTRFLAAEGNTSFEIVYKVPYKELAFEQKEDRFEANLRVAIVIEQGEKRSVVKQFDNPIITLDQQKTVSNTEFYMDKISLTLSKGMMMELDFIDTNSLNEGIYRKDLVLLTPDEVLSDIEICTNVFIDTTRRYVKFSRGDTLYISSPDRVFNLQNNKKLYMNYQVINLEQTGQGSAQYEEIMTITKGDVIVSQTNDSGYLDRKNKFMLKTFDLTNYQSGKYNVQLTLKDVQSGKETMREGMFIVRAGEKTRYRMFTDINDDLQLVKTFLPIKEQNVLETLSEDAIDNYIDHFWRVNDIDPSTEKNEFFELIQERVNHVNGKFSRFDNGWKTDQGRIYLRYGEPAEITSDFTDPSQTRFATKEYQIWKYETPERRVYLFIDNMMNGNFQLVYVTNDDKEQTLPSWQRYFGDDFDESALQ